jgi:hypothetical protein
VTERDDLGSATHALVVVSRAECLAGGGWAVAVVPLAVVTEPAEATPRVDAAGKPLPQPIAA